ncbi:MAG: hypothetical protein ACFB10_02230, partial [Salibacteraceae bacterium]
LRVRYKTVYAWMLWVSPMQVLLLVSICFGLLKMGDGFDDLNGRNFHKLIDLKSAGMEVKVISRL